MLRIPLQIAAFIVAMIAVNEFGSWIDNEVACIIARMIAWAIMALVAEVLALVIGSVLPGFIGKLHSLWVKLRHGARS